MQASNLFAEEVDARHENEHVGETGQPVGSRQWGDSEDVEPAKRRSGPGHEPRQDTHVAEGGEQELEAAEPGQVLGAGLQKELSHHRERHRTQDQDHRLSLHHGLPVSCRIRSVSEVRAQGKRTTETHFRNVRTYPKGWSSIRRLDVRAVRLRS